MQLSKNFSLDELTRSTTATRLCIDNSPSAQVVENLQALARNVLQPVRNHLGPIIISSGYRSPDLNKAIGGSRTSDHCLGFAADIQINNYDNQKLAKHIQAMGGFTQLILEFYEEGRPNSGWVHISYNPANLKNECLRAVKQAGKTVYLKGL
jgi:zinc D-Ala-D-Ala carboxypeptidase